jgi:hypothetical protein
MAVSGLDVIVDGRATMARLSDVFGANSPFVALREPSSVSTFLKEIKDTTPTNIPDGKGTVIGAGAGAVAGYMVGHPFLGAIAGGSLGRNLPAFIKTGPENAALRQMAVENMSRTGVSVVGSLIGGRVGSPIMGFGAGWVAYGVYQYFYGQKKVG